MIKRKILFVLMLALASVIYAYNPEFSTAGFFQLENTGRQVFSMNVGWKFYKGDMPEAYSTHFNDSEWEMVSVPHGIEYLPLEASGGVNYQGIVWYRNHFKPTEAIRGKKIFLHFEAIMGQCKIWVNGKLVKEHFGGYLPIIADISEELSWEADNVIAVCADNSDNPLYPPGKPQNALDFAYFGGIYRDCWLITHNRTFITDPNYEEMVAGGGIFTSFEGVSEQRAVLNLKAHIRHEHPKSFNGTLEYELINPAGKTQEKRVRRIKVLARKSVSLDDKIKLEYPQLWTPEKPQQYQLLVRIKNNKGEVVDGFRQKIGIRSLEFKGTKGFFLNGKQYEKPLLGGNRHQDFAVVGNATSNNINWRDAYKLKKAGFNIIRLCHYPQDPSFMDACDELGLFVIVPTPGWQYWNLNPIFGQRVESDIRQMVRRDRNHPSLLFWEPILNETGFWGDALQYDEKVQSRAAEIVSEEYPYNYVYSGGGPESAFTIIYGGTTNPTRVGFIREYGDGINVNDWHGQNAPNRAALGWGEIPMLVQAKSYSSSLADLYTTFQKTPQQLGGAVWHSFDTQRGYHPDPFYGGIMDAFRQPKYAYYMYMSQRDPLSESCIDDGGPMVHIAHEMTPFSPNDVTVYTNCDEIKLMVYEGGKEYSYKKNKENQSLPSPIVLFKDVYHYDDWKQNSRSNQLDKIYMLAKGYIDGKLVATHQVRPSNRAEKIILSLDSEGVDLMADGSDFVTVVASVIDSKGNVKRLSNHSISFEVEGEGRILGDAACMANPRQVIWGAAPVLIQATAIHGPIKVKAYVTFQGSRTPVEGELVFESHAAKIPFLHPIDKVDQMGNVKSSPIYHKRTTQQKRETEEDLKKVYQQQDFFMQE